MWDSSCVCVCVCVCVIMIMIHGLLIRDVQPKNWKYTVGNVQKDGVEKIIITTINNNSNTNNVCVCVWGRWWWWQRPSGWCTTLGSTLTTCTSTWRRRTHTSATRKHKPQSDTNYFTVNTCIASLICFTMCAASLYLTHFVLNSFISPILFLLCFIFLLNISTIVVHLFALHLLFHPLLHSFIIIYYFYPSFLSLYVQSTFTILEEKKGRSIMEKFTE